MEKKDWPEMTREGPYKAKMSKVSTGYVKVVDRNGNSVATCYSNGSDRATAIAYALNIAFPIVTDGEADAEDAAEANETDQYNQLQKR